MSTRTYDKNVTKAGWVGAAFGLLLGMLVTALIATGPAKCQEDEVAIWQGDGRHENTHCIHIENLLD